MNVHLMRQRASSSVFKIKIHVSDIAHNINKLQNCYMKCNVWVFCVKIIFGTKQNIFLYFIQIQ